MAPMNRKQAAKQCVAALDTKFFKAFCEPMRVAVFSELVLAGASDIATLAARMPQDRSVISRHLQVLADAGIVKSHKEGRRTIYAIAPNRISDYLWEMLTLTRALQACEDTETVSGGD